MSDFDITKHEWFDTDLTRGRSSVQQSKAVIIEVRPGTKTIGIEREDAIALARHFKLTPKDLT